MVFAQEHTTRSIPSVSIRRLERKRWKRQRHCSTRHSNMSRELPNAAQYLNKENLARFDCINLKGQKEDVLETVQNVMQAVEQLVKVLYSEERDPNISYTDSITNMCDSVKIYGRHLDMSFRDRMNNAFKTLEKCTGDRKKLDNLSRLQLFQLFQLRSTEWRNKTPMALALNGNGSVSPLLSDTKLPIPKRPEKTERLLSGAYKDSRSPTIPVTNFELNVEIEGQTITMSGKSFDLLLRTKEILEKHFSSSTLELNNNNTPEITLPRKISSEFDNSSDFVPFRRSSSNYEQISQTKESVKPVFQYSYKNLAGLSMSPLCLTSPKGWDDVTKDHPQVIRDAVGTTDVAQYLSVKTQNRN